MILVATPCAFCQRTVKTRKHHLVPKCKGGGTTADTCESCESFIHKTWSHNELRDTYNTVQAVLQAEPYQKFLKWLLKQKETTFFRTTKNNDRTGRRYA